MEKITNECFLYDLFHSKNNDSNIIILKEPDLSQLLRKKKYKEFIVTVVLSEKSYNNKEKYYFYEAITITISQKLLDKDFREPLTKTEEYLIKGGIVFGIILLYIIIFSLIKANCPGLLNRRSMNDEDVEELQGGLVN